MYNNATTIALYDTLGIDASRFIIEQCELQTICCSVDIVDKVLQYKSVDLKLPLNQQKCRTLKNMVTFEKVLDESIAKRVN